MFYGQITLEGVANMTKLASKAKSSPVVIDYREKKGMSKDAFEKSFDKDLRRIARIVNRITMDKRNGAIPLED